MRVPAAILLLLVGGVACQPITPTWRRDRTDASPDATEASARVPVLPPTVWQTIGESVQGRPLRMTRLGRGPRRVIWIGGIHGDEREGHVSTEQLPHALAAVPGALEQVTLTIIEDINPDGAAHNTRANANGVDLNRNYPARNFLASPQFGQRPLDQPESKALHDLVLEEQPHLIIVAHAWRQRHFINFDGPAADLAATFSQRSGYPVERSDKIAPTPGSLGSWVGGTLGLPILTLEHERGTDPLWAWMQTRDAILAVLLQA